MSLWANNMPKWMQAPKKFSLSLFFALIQWNECVSWGWWPLYCRSSRHNSNNISATSNERNERSHIQTSIFSWWNHKRIHLHTTQQQQQQNNKKKKYARWRRRKRAAPWFFFGLLRWHKLDVCRKKYTHVCCCCCCWCYSWIFFSSVFIFDLLRTHLSIIVYTHSTNSTKDTTRQDDII